ncbi:LacI family transcriptional regulator [Alkalihalobacillus xiaoxiensis]|uniref:LacI family transcriptional regulator n=1 Tax=Shouchella xiaoxiensis TaxID=766895 RepID=A0ABS2T1S5_9BACI|nr:LacI family DNA-binding transcriptional regulator [Shouchella xiaoxiensis]MBM7840945.1 LacI family transcriptional regulator [Shouchella xiaoxiensis]
MATIREIAEKVGVSVGTASFVLNGKADDMRISKKTQTRVLEAAKELGYQPSLSARKLRVKGKEVPVIAILWTLDARTSLISRFLQGIQSKSTYQEGQFELLIQPYENGKLRELHALKTGLRFNGAIIANASDEDMHYLEQANLNLPIVVYQRHSKNYATVLVDSEKTGRDVAKKFIQNGHKQVSIVIPEVSSEAVALRIKGFLEECRVYQIEVDELYGDFSEAGGYAVTKQLLMVSPLPSAIFFLSDYMAIGALSALHEANVKVPKDIQLIGHDNMIATQFTIPTLSTVNLPVEEMAEASVNLLLKILRNAADPHEQLKFSSYILERESSSFE